MTRTLVGSETGDAGAPEQGCKGFASADAFQMEGWDADLKTWHERTPSYQEMQLRNEGIINEGSSFAYFNRETRQMITDDPRPVIYPWVDPPSEVPPTRGGDVKVDWLVPDGPE